MTSELCPMYVIDSIKNLSQVEARSEEIWCTAVSEERLQIKTPNNDLWIKISVIYENNVQQWSKS